VRLSRLAGLASWHKTPAADARAVGPPTSQALEHKKNFEALSENVVQQGYHCVLPARFMLRRQRQATDCQAAVQKPDSQAKRGA